jgi:hypothetical protein
VYLACIRIHIKNTPQQASKTSMKNDDPQLQINKTTQKPLPKPKHLINSATKQKNTQVMPNIAPHHNCASSHIVVRPFHGGKLLQCS